MFFRLTDSHRDVYEISAASQMGLRVAVVKNGQALTTGKFENLTNDTFVKLIQKAATTQS